MMPGWTPEDPNQDDDDLAVDWDCDRDWPDDTGCGDDE